MPPPTPGLGRSVLMALVAHAALVLALSFAVQWRQSAPEPVAFAAELWAALPTEAAPPAAEPLPIGFNRFVMNQLNERLGQFIAAREIDRMNNPDARVARSLAALFNPVLYPGVGEVLRITQQELAYLIGLSRQRVNEALTALAAQGSIRVEYGGLRVLDLAALRSHVQPR